MVVRIAAILLLIALPFSASACGSRTPCAIDNAADLEELDDFWATVSSAKSLDEATELVLKKWHQLPIDFVGDDKQSNRYMHVKIIAIERDWIAYYSRAPIVRVDVSILAPGFAGPTRRWIEVGLTTLNPLPPPKLRPE